MTIEQWEDVLDGCALVERTGDLYMYAGTLNGKFSFQSVNDDYHFEISFEDAIKLDVTE